MIAQDVDAFGPWRPCQRGLAKTWLKYLVIAVAPNVAGRPRSASRPSRLASSASEPRPQAFLCDLANTYPGVDTSG
jgi:hypothetical protein